jgi:hypothetical protein
LGRGAASILGALFIGVSLVERLLTAVGQVLDVCCFLSVLLGAARRLEEMPAWILMIGSRCLGLLLRVQRRW